MQKNEKENERKEMKRSDQFRQNPPEKNERKIRKVQRIVHIVKRNINTQTSHPFTISFPYPLYPTKGKKEKAHREP